jgi:hypothetical protein
MWRSLGIGASPVAGIPDSSGDPRCQAVRQPSDRNLRARPGAANTRQADSVAQRSLAGAEWLGRTAHADPATTGVPCSQSTLVAGSVCAASERSAVIGPPLGAERSGRVQRRERDRRRQSWQVNGATPRGQPRGVTTRHREGEVAKSFGAERPPPDRCGDLAKQLARMRLDAAWGARENRRRVIAVGVRSTPTDAVLRGLGTHLAAPIRRLRLASGPRGEPLLVAGCNMSATLSRSKPSWWWETARTERDRPCGSGRPKGVSAPGSGRDRACRQRGEPGKRGEFIRRWLASAWCSR